MPSKFQFKSAAGVAAIGLAAVAAGCTTQPQSTRVATYGAPYVSSNYTGPDRLYRNGYVENTRPRVAHSATASEARVLAAYEGVEGARLAHQIYGEAHAERLDGACEPFVKITQGETLYDIAQLCDVPVSMLVDHNPVVRNPRHVKAGQIVEVPQIFNAERHALASASSGVELASFYVVQPGDTLSDIAAKHLVSSASVANLNPGVRWEYLPVGAQVRIPVAGAATSPFTPPANAVVSGALPYAYGPASAYGSSSTGSYAPPSNVTAVMPYVMTPAQKAAEREGAKSKLLTVNRKTVNPGGNVTVSATGLPANKEVSIYRGPNGSQLDHYKTVRTDSEGRINVDVPVKAGESKGGVIFRATVDDTGEELQSPRVGVDDLE